MKMGPPKPIKERQQYPFALLHVLPAEQGQFFNFNLFEFIFKNNSWQTLFALGDPFGRA
jgi:hypothetical protein